MPEILSVEGKGNSRTSRQSIFSSPWNWFSSLHKFDKFFIIAALLIVVATPFIVSNNQNFNPEAKGPRGGCHGKNCPPTPTCPTCILTVSPNPVPLNSQSIAISGMGFKANQVFYIDFGWLGDPEVTADANGSFSITYSHNYWAPGQYTARAYLIDNTTLATTTYTVCSVDPATGQCANTWGTSTSPLLNTQATTNTSGTTGNGAPSGPHFNLNIIGVPKDKTADISTGNRIFVPLVGSCQIKLAEGDYSVIDGNCTDDGSATFQLPNPDPTNSGTTTYSVWAKALGKPGGSSSTTTCATDPTTNELYCSVYTVIEIRTKGQSSFTNVTKDLLYVYADVLGTGKPQRYPLFDSTLENYYWQYDNNGLKNMQLRFYQIPTVVP